MYLYPYSFWHENTMALISDKSSPDFRETFPFFYSHQAIGATGNLEKIRNWIRNFSRDPEEGSHVPHLAQLLE